MSEASLLVLTTCPDAETADRIAATLVEERLAACTNQLGPIGSVYRWQGRVTRDSEYLLLVKTTAAGLPALEQRVKRLHPYQMPEIIAVPITAGSTDYLAWLAESVRPPPAGETR